MGKDDKKDMEGAAGTRDIVKETKGMMFQEAMSKFMDEGKAKGRKIQNIFEEIDKLGMTEDECWKEAMETEGNRSRKTGFHKSSPVDRRRYRIRSGSERLLCKDE